MTPNDYEDERQEFLDELRERQDALDDDTPWNPLSFASEGEGFYEDLADALHIGDDERAAEMLENGWFNEELSEDEIAEWQEAFYEYLDIEPSEFWEIWRENYE